MLLTIKQPAVHQGYKSFHDYTPPTPPSTSRFSPAVTTTGPSFPSIPITNKSLPPLPPPRSTTHISQQMSTPHRGLPPPAAMTLPQPTQHPPSIGQPPPLNLPLGQLPAPPQQWQDAEESMRNWLHAKAEEDKRKQEEEKTRQETLRLEQRKIEQEMLRTSLSGGIPPHLIPMVFAGMGGGSLPNASLEWAQQYMAQAHHTQQQQIQQQQQQQLLPSQSHTSPEQLQRRDSRAPVFSAQQPQQTMTLPSTPVGAPTAQQVGGFNSSYPMSPVTRSRANTGNLTRPPATSHLPRLNTGEMHIQQVPVGPPGTQILPGQPGHPLSQSQPAQQLEPQSSPSIYFHHWQPPTSQASMSGANQPTTPSDHTSSPKKRKATGPQQAAPPPTSQPQYTSPQFSQTGSSVSNTPSSRRRGHSRHQSDISSRGMESSYRPASRHRHTDSNFNTQSMTSPPGPEQGPMSDTRQRPGRSHPISSLVEPSEPRPSYQSQQIHHDTQHSEGPEMRHEERRPSPKGDEQR